MFEYEIYYRIDTSEFLETDSIVIRGNKFEDIVNDIAQIEKRNTIIYVKNISIGIQ